MPLFDGVLKRRVVILDGGMSSALEDRGHDLSDDLWTARLLRDDPDEIVAVHRAYFEAGADVLTAVETAVSVTGKPGVTYPNRGEAWDAPSHSWAGQGSFDPALATTWVEAGARLIGGCCRVGPADIARLATSVGSWKR